MGQFRPLLPPNPGSIDGIGDRLRAKLPFFLFWNWSVGDLLPSRHWFSLRTLLRYTNGDLGCMFDCATAHLISIALPNPPFSPVIVTTSVAWSPRGAVKPVDAGVTEKSCKLKVAVTETAPSMVTVHTSVPVQDPIQLENDDPKAGRQSKSPLYPQQSLVSMYSRK